MKTHMLGADQDLKLEWLLAVMACHSPPLSGYAPWLGIGFFKWCMYVTYFIENMEEPGITFIYFVALVDRIPALPS